MRLIFILFFSCFLSTLSHMAHSQNVRLLQLDALEQRMERGKDTLYIVNFWASWCAPCLDELPNFEKLREGLKDQKVKMILISLDFKSKLKTEVEPLVKRMKLKSEVFLLDEKNQQTYIERIDPNWSGALPATLFVHQARDKRQFFEQEFSYEDLMKTYYLNK